MELIWSVADPLEFDGAAIVPTDFLVNHNNIDLTG